MHPVEIVEELGPWDRHSPEAIQEMLDGITRLREQGLDVFGD